MDIILLLKKYEYLYIDKNKLYKKRYYKNKEKENFELINANTLNLNRDI